MGTTSIDNSGGTQNAIEQVDLGRGDLGAVEAEVGPELEVAVLSGRDAHDLPARRPRW